jgi:ketosteroid isomerase-like protein
MARTKGAKDAKPRKPRNGSGDVPERSNTGQSPASLTEAEQQALYVNGIASLEELIKQKDGLVSSIRTHRQKMNASGFSSDDIDFGLELRKNDTEAKAKAMITQRQRQQTLAKWLNHPVAQLDLFERKETASDLRPVSERAYAEGKIVGLEGKQACKPPSNFGGEAEQQWIHGWHDGQAELTKAGISPLRPQQHPTPQPGAFDDAMADAGSGEASDEEASADQQTAH